VKRGKTARGTQRYLLSAAAERVAAAVIEAFLHPGQGGEPTQNVLSSRSLDDHQRHARKCLQDPLCCRLVGPLVLVLWVQTGEARLRLFQSPAQDKLCDGEHSDPERQEVREAFNLLVELHKQRGDLQAALEAVENTLNTIF